MPLSLRDKWKIDRGLNSHMPVLLPGMNHAPLIIPYCRICGEPVEEYQTPKTDWFHLEVEAHCCGRQQGRRVSIEEIKRIHATGDKLWLITRKGETQSIERYGGRIQVGGLTYKVGKRKVAR